MPIVRQPALLVGTMMLSTKEGQRRRAGAAGGTGYAVGDTIELGNGVVLTVATVTTGAVATVTVTNAGSVASGGVPTNPVAASSTGAGTGAYFNLTWVDDVVVPGSGLGIPNVPKPIGTQTQADREYGQGSRIGARWWRHFWQTILRKRCGACRCRPRLARSRPRPRSR